jgi:hypothetical protein
MIPKNGEYIGHKSDILGVLAMGEIVEEKLKDLREVFCVV